MSLNRAGFIRKVRSVRRGFINPKLQLLAALTGFFLFSALAWAAFSKLSPEISLSQIRLELLVLGALLTPLTIAMNAMEYQLSGRILGVHPTARVSLHVSVKGALANLLPIPGAAIVRIQALRGMGSSALMATQSNVVVAIIWVGSAAMTAGLFNLGANRDLASLLILIGVLTTLVGGFFFPRYLPLGKSVSLFSQVAMVEVGLTLLTGIRMYLGLTGLGITANFSQALTIGLSGVVASIIGVIPGGLGLREAVAGGFAALSDMPSSHGILGATAYRLGEALVMAPLAFAVLWRLRHRGADSSPLPDVIH